jgi:hypothetical protein
MRYPSVTATPALSADFNTPRRFIKVMFESERRKFLTQTGLGLTGIAGLILRADARPTQAIVNTEESDRILIQMAPPPKMEITARGELKKITPQPYGH